MELAINYSPQAAELLAAGKIELNRFKCPDWPWMIAEAAAQLPVAVHFPLEVGSGRLSQADWQLVERLRQETNTPYVNVHIAAHAKDYPEIDRQAPTRQQAQRIRAVIEAELSEVVARFGAKNVIAENCPYHAAKGNLVRTCVEPEVIHASIKNAGCGLLFDLSHARISAHYLGMDENEYLAGLPMEHLREMHFTGMQVANGRLEDHLGATPADWQALKVCLERIGDGEWSRPWLLAFEYGGVGKTFEWRSDAGVIAEQMPTLARMLATVATR